MSSEPRDGGGNNPVPLELGNIVPAAFVGAITIFGCSYVHTLFRAAGLSPLMLDDSLLDAAFRWDRSDG